MRYTETMSGTVTNTPKALPPPVDLDSRELHRMLLDARCALGELNGFSFSVPKRFLFLTPSIIRESVESFQIENINMTVEQARSTAQALMKVTALYQTQRERIRLLQGSSQRPRSQSRSFLPRFSRRFTLGGTSKWVTRLRRAISRHSRRRVSSSSSSTGRTSSTPLLLSGEG